MATPPEWDMLLSAAQKNRPEIIAEMVEIGGVDPSHSNAVGQSAVHIAALWGHHESVQALSALGANVNAQNGMTGATPLHMVAQSLKSTVDRRLRCAEILVAHGARVDQPDHYGMMPVQVLRQVLEEKRDAVDDELTQKLIAAMEPTRPDIHAALAERNVSRLQELLEKDAALSNLPYQGDAPIEFVTNALIQSPKNEGESVEDDGDALVRMLELLLKHGGNANGSESNSGTAALSDPGEVKEVPLHKLVCALRDCINNNRQQDSSSTDTSTSPAAARCLEAAIDLLVQAGATVTPETAQLLHLAARRDEVTFARFLIEKLHVDANLKGRQGMTALQFAARSGKMDMLHFLLKQPGIDVHSKDDRGKTALDAARVNEKSEAIKALEEFDS